MSSDSDSSSHSSEPRSEPPVRSKRARANFTELNVDYDQPFAIPNPLYVHSWEKYPEFVEKLVYGEDVPPPPSAEAGPSSQSTSTPMLPPLGYPIEQSLAALMAAFDSEKQFTERRVEDIHDTLECHRETRSEVKKLKQENKEVWRCHTSLAHGVQDINEKFEGVIAEIKAELEAAKVERAKDRAEIAALRAELNVARQEREILNHNLLQMQQNHALLAQMVQQNGEPEEEEEEEVEGDFIEVEDLAGDPIELEEENGEPEVIDP